MPLLSGEVARMQVGNRVCSMQLHKVRLHEVREEARMKRKSFLLFFLFFCWLHRRRHEWDGGTFGCDERGRRGC
jgi:hypothetical protein